MKARTHVLSMVTIVGAITLGLVAPAFALGPTPADPQPAAHHATEPGANGLGVGAAAFVSGLMGPQVVYDFGVAHIEGLLGFDHRTIGGGPNPPGVTTFNFGASGWYHLHRGDRSDFSLGGGVGFINASPSGGTSASAAVLEPGAQMRVFITSNVALHARLGLSLVFGDDVANPAGGGAVDKHWGIGGQLVSGFGFTYFFR